MSAVHSFGSEPRSSSLLSKRALIPAVIAMLMITGVSFAGVEVRVVTVDHGTDPAKETAGVMLLGEGNLSMDLGLGPDGKSGQNTTIFQAGSQSFVVVDHGEKAYSVMDEEAISMIAEEMENAMMMLDQKMSTLPPEQRKILRDSLLKGQERLPNKVTGTDQVATKAGFSTRKYEVHRGEELVREVWVADWSAVPESDDVKAALQGLEGFFDRLQKMFNSLSAGSLGGAKPFDMGDSPFQDLSQMNGFPVLTRNYEGGKLTTETRIESLDKTELTADTFEPPKDYRKRTMNGGR